MVQRAHQQLSGQVIMGGQDGLGWSCGLIQHLGDSSFSTAVPRLQTHCSCGLLMDAFLNVNIAIHSSKSQRCCVQLAARPGTW